MTNREASKILNFLPNNKPWEVEALAMAIKLLDREAMWEEAPPYLPNTERRDCLNCVGDCAGHRFGNVCDRWRHK